MQPHLANSSSFIYKLTLMIILNRIRYSMIFWKIYSSGLTEDECWFLPFSMQSNTGRSTVRWESRCRGLETQWDSVVCCGLHVYGWFPVRKYAEGSFGKKPSHDLYQNKATVSFLPVLPNFLILSVAKPGLLLHKLNLEFCFPVPFTHEFLQAPHHLVGWGVV